MSYFAIGTGASKAQFAVSQVFVAGSGSGTNHFTVDPRNTSNWPTNLTSGLSLGAAPPFSSIINTHTMPVMPFTGDLTRFEVWVTYPFVGVDGTLHVYKIAATGGAGIGATTQLAVTALDGTGSATNLMYDVSVDISSGGGINRGDSFFITRKPSTTGSQNTMRVRSTLVFTEA